MQGGEHDQDMLYGILKELIQFLKMQSKACTSSSRVAMPIFQTHSEAGPDGVISAAQEAEAGGSKTQGLLGSREC